MKTLKKLLSEKIKEYEEEADKGRAQDYKIRNIFNWIRKTMVSQGMEFCCHNAAFFGSERYKKYLNPHLKRPISITEYSKLSIDQLSNFENLKEFPFTIENKNMEKFI